jgi:eukaryotic-like serine/threonine-protein kinase
MSTRGEAERWRRIEALFAEAAALAAGEREAFLDARCEGDGELRAELESLLGADAQDEDPLREVVEAAAVEVALEREAAAAGPPTADRVGPYRLIGVLGRGGTSTVHRAVRADDAYSMEVAVKTLHGGVLGPDTRERFRRERQILADLEHPNVARLLDGGTRDDGTPYVVMERVDGLPIDEHARRHRLGLRERIALFRKVCAAVQYAHQRLVVHRDLKPSNILVQADGTPKLLDFGIAKLLADEAQAATVTERRWMTPEYASPEQVRGERVSTASDVYSLGAVLYELLTGRRPYELASRSGGEIERVVSTATPAAPSAAVASVRDGAGSEPATTTIRPRELRGDLDNIVLMALRKEPERRYRSAGELDDDLERFEQGLPVRSRPDTIRYRTRKFVRRHRLGVATAALLLALLSGFGAVTFVQARHLAAERDVAELERDKARRVAGFLTETLTARDDAGVPAGELTARELIDRGAAHLADDALDDQPAVRAALLQAVGEVYLFHERTDRAQELLDEALVLRRAALGEEHLDTAESRAALGDLALRDRDMETAFDHYSAALEVRRRLAGEPSSPVADSLAQLATLHHMQGDFEESERLYRQALEQYRNLPGESERVLELMQIHAHLLGTLGHGEEALATMQRALTEAAALYGEDHVLVADIAGMLAVELKNRGRYEEARPLYLLTLGFWRDRVGVHFKTAQALNNYAVFQNVSGDPDAGPTYAAAIEMYTEVLGRDHPDMAQILGNYATWTRKNGSLAEARALYEEALGLFRAQPEGESFWVTAVYQAGYAVCLLEAGEQRRGEAELVHAVDVLLDKHARHRGARVAVESLLERYEQTGRAAEAAALRVRAVEKGTLEAGPSPEASSG